MTQQNIPNEPTIPVASFYENGECPDCGEPITELAVDGDDCPCCGHVFWILRDDDDC